MVTVSDLQIQNKLNFIRGRYNIINCDTRTGKTYWAVNNLKRFARDEQLNRVLFLVDTNSLKEAMLADYPELCCDADDWWCLKSTWGECKEKIGVMCYQSLSSKARRQELDFLDNIDCICWDECDTIFDFAAAAFAKARKTDFARSDISNEEILAVIQKYSTKKDYDSLILLGEWERIVSESRIMCIGLSATPERTQAYYQSLVKGVNEGRIQNIYRSTRDVYFYNLRELLFKLQPAPNKGYWCYSPWITENQTIVQLASSLGFKAIELHSSNNKEHPMTEEQKRVSDIILATHMVPKEYDFVIVNKAYERGYTIEDERFDQVIVNSMNKTERDQAGRMVFEHQRFLKTFAPEIPPEYLNVWLPVDECRQLAETLSILDVNKTQGGGKIMAWNKLKDYLPAFGYKCEGKRKRINGKLQQCYFISGEWKDAEIEDGNFLALVEAKSSSSS